MSIKKQFLKSKPLCKVTFELTPETVGAAEHVSILGSFNSWSPSLHQMKKLKDGTFKTTLDLDIESEHQFRYLVDGKIWLNDEEADKFINSGVGSEKNSVIAL
jgi:1,4-alpha-glucan branching enzyme